MTSHFQAIVIRNDTEPLRLSAPGQWDEVKSNGQGNTFRTRLQKQLASHLRIWPQL